MPEARQTGTLEAITMGIGHFLAPLEKDLAEGKARVLLAELGLQLPPSADGVPAFTTAISGTFNAAKQLPSSIGAVISAIDSDEISSIVNASKELANNIINVIEGISDISDAIENLSGPTGIPYSVLTDFASNLPKRLIDFLIVRNIELVPVIPELLEFIGALDRKLMNSGSVDPNAPEFTEYAFHIGKLTGFIQAPLERLKEMYDWGSNSFDGSKLLPKLQDLAGKAGYPAIVDDTVSPEVLDIVFAEIRPRTDLNPKGIEVKLIKEIDVDKTIPFNQGGDWQLEAILNSDLDAEASLTIQPDGTIGFNSPSLAGTGEYGIRFNAGKADGTPFIIFGEAGKSRLEVKQFLLEAKSGLNFDSGGIAIAPFKISGEIKGGRLIIDTSGADGFINKLLSGIKVENEFNLGMGFSSSQGLFFHGSSVLEIRLSIHISLGPVEINGLYLSFGIRDKEYPVGLATDIKASLGPLGLVVENFGMEAVMTVPDDHKGNAGPLDFKIGFKPPKGIGISIDAAVIKGGGYLFFDWDKEEYAGALELTFSDFLSLKAIGLVTTRMPDGSKGFSLVIIITAEFTIQLGYGFVFLGAGGLLGLHRTMMLEPLAEGVKTGATTGIMFPVNIVENAPRIISDLRVFFPVEEGKFLIGPMARLGWGTPTIISITLGIIIEIRVDNNGGIERIAILGVLKCILPDEQAALLVLQVNFIGAIDFEKKYAFFFASIYDSRILFITLEGEMGLLVAWGEDSDFVVSVGGFHPRFNPPPLPFPVPRRVALNILNESWGKIRVEAYFAVTTNTVQFGAKLELFFGCSEFKIEGNLAFDALFQFNPFYFIIEISGKVSLVVFGLDLLSISLKFSLEGTSPWRATGYGKIKILFFTIKASFDKTWGESRNTQLPPIQIIPILTAELEKTQNWMAVPPESGNLLVTLRKLPEPEEESDETLVLHPLGILRVSQRAVPLRITIDKVGSRKPDDAHKLDFEPSGDFISVGDRKESFARAQFQDMDDSKKLSSPSYEKEVGGLDLSATGDQIRFGRIAVRHVRYELITIDTGYKRFMIRFFGWLQVLFVHFLANNAARRSTLSYRVKKEYQPFREKIEVLPGAYTIANTKDNKPFNAAAVNFGSLASAEEYMIGIISKDPSMADSIHVIPNNEINASI
jgi:hypothetical protein